MLRKVVSAAVIMVLCVGVTLAEEIRAIITKVDGDKVTFAENKGKGEKGESKTLPVDAKVKVVKGKYDKDTMKTTALDEAIEGGLKHKMFTEIGESRADGNFGNGAQAGEGDDGNAVGDGHVGVEMQAGAEE